MHSLFTDKREESPEGLEEKHRQEAREIEIYNIMRMQSSMNNAPGVLSFRKAQRLGATQANGPPTMQSLYDGRATFLDYKKRAKPINNRELVKRLENPMKKEVNIHAKFIKRSQTATNLNYNNQSNVFLTEAKNLYGGGNAAIKSELLNTIEINQ